MRSGPKSRAMFHKAKKVMPCGVSSNFRYWGDDENLVVKRAKGAYLWDQDGKKYIDYQLGFGPVILGHAYPSVVNRVKEALEIGNVFAMTHEYEISVGEKIKKLTGVDLVRYANSGTEATMHAVRIARAYTGRNKVLKFEGHYHGLQDYALWNYAPPISEIGCRKSPILTPQMSGIPYSIGELVIVVPFNDKELLEKKVKENWGDIACIILEPIMGNVASVMPEEDFLGYIRELCDQYGIVMIMDEVKTGFRVAKGGAQEYFNVKADLVTYAKALGNGFPIAAIGGKREIMEEVAPLKIPHGGTYVGNVVATAAADATLDEIMTGALDKVNQHGEKLMGGLRKILQEKGIPAVIQGPPSLFGIVFTKNEKIVDYRDWAMGDYDIHRKVLLKLIEKGVMHAIDPREPWFISASHSDREVDYVLGTFEEVIKEVFDKN